MSTTNGTIEVVPSTSSGESIAAGPSASGSRNRRTSDRAIPYALLFPSLIVLGAIVGWPLIQLVIMSFQEYGRRQVFGAPAPFVGLQNYIDVLTDITFWNVLSRSFIFAAVNVGLTMVLGTLVALLMTRLAKTMRVVMSVGLLLAWAMPQLTSTIVWGWIFDTAYGVVNFVLVEWLGLAQFQGHSWLIEPISFFGVATVIIVWGAIPFVAFTVYAGLTQIPAEIVEAAQLDGASAGQRFRLITLPYLRSIFLIVTILQVIWDLRVFTQIFALQGIGGIAAETSTLGVYIYQVALGSGEYGIGGATAIIMVLIMMAVSIVYVRRSIKEEGL